MLSTNINSPLGFMKVIYSSTWKTRASAAAVGVGVMLSGDVHVSTHWSVHRGMQWKTEVGFGAEDCKKCYLCDPPQLVVPLQSLTVHGYQFVFFFFCGGIDPEND